MAGRAPVIAFGSGQPHLAGAPSEAAHSRERAMALGVHADAIVVGPDSLCAVEECTGIARMLRGRGVHSVIPCTSAYHVARAVPHYRRAGFEVMPLPSDFMSRDEDERVDMRMLIPGASALGGTNRCAKEWLGRAAQLLGSALHLGER